MAGSVKGSKKPQKCRKPNQGLEMSQLSEDEILWAEIHARCTNTCDSFP